MNTIDNGGAAFPRTGYYPATGDVHNEDMHAVLASVTTPTKGMTLLDHFASVALNGLIAMSADGPHEVRLCEKVARMAYAYGVAMIAERRRLTDAKPMCECDDDGQDGGGAASKLPGGPLIPPPAWKEWDLPGPPQPG